MTVATADPWLAQQFATAADRWRRETRFSSSRRAIIGHPAYKEVIAMGSGVVPLILGSMAAVGGHWATALSALTGGDPVPACDRGDLLKVEAAWLAWGERGMPD